MLKRKASSTYAEAIDDASSCWSVAYTPTLGGDALIGPTGLELGVGGTLVAALYLATARVAMLTCEHPNADPMQNFLYRNVAHVSLPREGDRVP